MVTLLKPIGHCFGVLKALEIAKETVKKYPNKNIYVFGLLVHNEEVNEILNKLGIKTIENIDNPIDQLNEFTKDDIVIFTAHGHPLSYEETLKNNGVTFVDATCIKVKQCFDIISAAKEVIYIGKKNHPETKAALTMNNNAHFYDIKAPFDYSLVKSVNPLVINQTTLSFLELKEIHEDIKQHIPNAIIHDEICNATLLRQKAIEELDKDIDTLFIVGSKKSSNTLKLYEVALKIHQDKQIYFIENLEALKKLHVRFKNAAVTGGTSTPNETIYKVKEYLEEIEHDQVK